MSLGKRLLYISAGILLLLIISYFIFTGVNLNEATPT